jgi:hypothetical protein
MGASEYPLSLYFRFFQSNDLVEIIIEEGFIFLIINFIIIFQLMEC